MERQSNTVLIRTKGSGWWWWWCACGLDCGLNNDAKLLDFGGVIFRNLKLNDRGKEWRG